jgi:hypothetical protein
MSHLPYTFGGHEVESVANRMVRRYPEVMGTRILQMEEELQLRKIYLINYSLHCISVNIGPVYQ